MKHPNISQNRHEMLIDKISELKFYQIDGISIFKKIEKQRTFDKIKNIPLDELDASVKVIVDLLNFSGGSVGDIDIFKLFHTYLNDLDKRKEINNILTH